MHDDVADLPRLLEAHVRPALPAVRRLPHTVAMRDIAAERILAAAYVHDIGCRRRDRNGADRPTEIPVGNRRPRFAGVHGFEHAATRGPHPKLVRPRRVAGDGDRPSAAIGAELAPM